MKPDDMFRREQEAWRAFSDAVASVPADRRQSEGVVPGWSAHDLLWHCAYWTDYAGGVLERIRSGDTDPEGQAEPETDILATGRSKTWDEIVARAERARERARTAMTAFDDTPPPLAVQWFQEDTFEHYDEHAEQIRTFIG